ncbi:hypothetical protein ABIB40_002263 [Pedobacter sp. UYP30]
MEKFVILNSNMANVENLFRKQIKSRLMFYTDHFFIFDVQF